MSPPARQWGTRAGGRVPAYVEGYPFDLIVIGAGINGAGVARDAAMRGLKVLLLDKGDVGSGTTSYSTRLIHGGLRYLEYGEVGLVRESLKERARLLRIAPHLVKPVRMLIPIYRESRRSAWTIRAGLMIYDLLSADRSLGHHRFLSRHKTLELVPNLDPRGLRGAGVYHDAQAEYPERLCLENALSAAWHGATVLTYARVDGFLVEGHAVRGVRFTDLLGGTVHTARAPVVVNAAGPWVDEVLGALGWPVGRLLGGTKGSHLVVDPFRGGPRDALYFEAAEDGRPVFVVPWAGRYLIGTTDIRFQGSPDWVEADDGEIEYLIRAVNRVLPGADLTRDAVIYSYSGVRPLPYQEAGPEAAISRRHVILDHGAEAEGLISVIGGKLTTYRYLSEKVVDLVFRKLGRRPPACATALVPLPGATVGDLAAFEAWFRDRSGLPPATAERLVRLYGLRAVDILRLVEDDPVLGQAFSPSTGAIGAEVVWAFTRELALTLSDALLRRTMVALGPGAGLDADEAAARIGCTHLGWDEGRAEREVAAFRESMRRYRPRASGSPTAPA